MADRTQSPKRNVLKMTAFDVPESSIHKSTADLLDRALLPPAVWTTFPAGGYFLNPAARGKLVAYGLKPGMPDIQAMHQGRIVFIELKTLKGAASKDQQVMHARLLKAECPVYICRSVEAVLDALLRENFPLQPSYVRALLEQNYEPAERVGDPYGKASNDREAAGRRTSQSA